MNEKDSGWVEETIKKLRIAELYQEEDFEGIIGQLREETRTCNLRQSLWNVETLWNSIGVHFLQKGMYDIAIRLYTEMSLSFEKQGLEQDQHYHKGTPYHNLGVAHLRAGNIEEGRSHLIRAYWEDLIDARGDLEDVRGRPASKVYRNLFGHDPPLPEQVALVSSEVSNLVDGLPDAQDASEKQLAPSLTPESEVLFERIGGLLGSHTREIVSEFREMREETAANHRKLFTGIESLDIEVRELLLEIKPQVDEGGEDMKKDFLLLLEELPGIGKTIRAARMVAEFIEKHGVTITEKAGDILKKHQETNS